MNYISFCLWGNNPKYVTGAIKNKELAKEVYPNWTCLFYCPEDTKEDTIDKLSGDNSIVILSPYEGDWKLTTERFRILSEMSDNDVAIFRDTDSRLSHREKAAVYKWLNGPNTFHNMKDHPYHYSYEILAGMWGCKGYLPVTDSLFYFRKYWPAEYHYDQEFIKRHIIPFCSYRGVELHYKDFPVERGLINGLPEFVGESFEADDGRNLKHIEALKCWI